MSIKLTPLHEFTISLSQQIDQVTTRVEGDKTISETTKVEKLVNVPVCLKRPSRVEKEEADLERAVWETHFITKGILPRALLLKTYANHGGILSDPDKQYYNKLQTDFLLAETELRRLQVTETENKEAIERVASTMVDLRNKILDFQQDQAVFFENTAESKARQKLIEWLVLHLSFYKPVKSDESLDEWTPIFAGKTTEDKLASFDKMIEEGSELFVKSRSMLEFLATVLASSEGPISKEDIEAFAATMS